jgi:large subunit ribosomal protein L13
MERKYHLFDAKEKNLGRMATEIANVLSGRNKVDFAPNVDGGEYVVIVNSDQVQTTGGKMKKKMYHHYSGYPGGIKSLRLEEKIEKDSRKVFQEAVYGMLPKNKLRDKMIKRLLIYKDEKHNHKIDIKH